MLQPSKCIIYSAFLQPKQPIFRLRKNAENARWPPIFFCFLSSKCIELNVWKRKSGVSWEVKSVPGHLNCSPCWGERHLFFTMDTLKGDLPYVYFQWIHKIHVIRKIQGFKFNNNRKGRLKKWENLIFFVLFFLFLASWAGFRKCGHERW